MSILIIVHEYAKISEIKSMFVVNGFIVLHGQLFKILN